MPHFLSQVLEVPRGQVSWTRLFKESTHPLLVVVIGVGSTEVKGTYTSVCVLQIDVHRAALCVSIV